MAQAYQNTEAELDTNLDMSPPKFGQQMEQTEQTETCFVQHTKDASDASLAEFERLMAAMGYRQQESSV